MPAASCIGRPRWRSIPSVDRADLPDPARRRARVRGGTGEQRMAGSEPMYLFWLRRDDRGGRAADAVRGGGDRLRAGQRRRRAARLLLRAMRWSSPAIECLRRELMARDEILKLHNSLLEQDSDLEMLLSVSGRRRGQQARERRRPQGDRRERDRALKVRPVGADHPRERHRAGAGPRPSRRSRPRCSPRRTVTCCRWRRCVARP